MASAFMLIFQMFFSIVVALMWINCAIAPVHGLPKFNAIVALDGSGNFKSIGAAILAAPSDSNVRFYIRVKPGTYHERVVIPKPKRFIALIGDNALTTIIVDNRSNGTGFKTSDSATLTVQGNNFMAQSLSFENSAGPKNGQAVAVLDEARNTSYYKCKFFGFQDTLYVKGLNQFFKECDIYGTIDFIFGNGLVLLQDCNIYARMSNQLITLTAQSKKSIDDYSGFSFHNCTITVSPEITLNRSEVYIYLGRPWREYSNVVFIESFMDKAVMPRGWLEWGNMPLNHLYYGEYNNKGLGADVTKRVNWAGFHVMDRKTALQFTVDNFINGSKWLPETGIPFRRGLIS